MKIATSPEIGFFRKKIIQERYEKNEISVEEYANWVEHMSKFDNYLSEIKEEDFEFELRSCEWVVEKCKKSEDYSKKIYAALCNNLFEKNDKEYSCSWRHAGAIVAHLNEKGDYIDWYCSGNEGFLDEEIREDFNKIGWKLKKHLGEE